MSSQEKKLPYVNIYTRLLRLIFSNTLQNTSILTKRLLEACYFKLSVLYFFAVPLISKQPHYLVYSGFD